MKPKITESRIIDCIYGKDVEIITPCNLYGCTLGDNVFVGPFCEIQRDVKIGARTRIQSHSFICSLVSIGEDCFIGHGVMFINDKFLLGHPAKSPKEWKKTRIGNRVSIGSNVSILPVNICDDVVIGSGAVITHDISKSGFYVGNPARFLRALPQDEE